MRSLLRVSAAALLLSALGCATLDQKPAADSSSEDGAELTAVIEAVKQSIVEAETREVSGFPELKKIVVKLQTSVSRSASGEVRYLVASAGGGTSSDAVSTLEIDFKPAEAARLLPRTENLKDALARAIHLAKVGVAQAGKGDPPLAVKSVVIDLKFTVSTQGSAGASVRLLPVGLAATAKIAREKVHSVSLTFGSQS